MGDVKILTDRYIKRYHDVRNQTLTICAPLLPEDHVVQPIVDVSPPKWHLGHTTWFFETFILKNFHKQYRIFDTDYNYLFNSYYESIGNRVIRTDRGNLTRPGVAEIQEYRRYVDVFMNELLETADDERIFHLTELGLQHEQQHQELLVTDIKYILGNNPLFPEYKKIKSSPEHKVKEMKFVEVPGGMYEIGYKGKEFCFDNEQPAHKIYVDSFSSADRLVTNEEYLQFMEDGGYKDFRFWLMEGWELVKALKWNSPLYWVKKSGDWFEYTLGGLKPLVLSEPVTHISFYEADAYAKWAGKRLLTEMEWEVASQVLNQSVDGGNFLESGNFHPVAEVADSIQLLGNAWQWTYSSYSPYPGYEQEEGALGEYNGKFMINQMVLRGGSCATPRSHIRATYRNFFHPDKRWQFTGIRLANKD